MKHWKNKVNPKAGTLKQKDEKAVQNVSRKTIAFVLMLTLMVQTGISGTLAGVADRQSGSTFTEKDSVTKMAHTVKLKLPSRESIRKADAEMNRNMYRSLRENRIRNLEKEFERNDAEMNHMFMKEHSISAPVAIQADEDIQISFMAENISTVRDPAPADREMNTSFLKDLKGISLNIDHGTADEWMHARFQAENISLPSAEMIDRADLEINLYMYGANPYPAIR